MSDACTPAGIGTSKRLKYLASLTMRSEDFITESTTIEEKEIDYPLKSRRQRLCLAALKRLNA